MKKTFSVLLMSLAVSSAYADQNTQDVVFNFNAEKQTQYSEPAIDPSGNIHYGYEEDTNTAKKNTQTSQSWSSFHSGSSQVVTAGQKYKTSMAQRSSHSGYITKVDYSASVTFNGWNNNNQARVFIFAEDRYGRHLGEADITNNLSGTLLLNYGTFPASAKIGYYIVVHPSSSGYSIHNGPIIRSAYTKVDSFNL